MHGGKHSPHGGRKLCRLCAPANGGNPLRLFVSPRSIKKNAGVVCERGVIMFAPRAAKRNVAMRDLHFSASGTPPPPSICVSSIPYARGSTSREVPKTRVELIVSGIHCSAGSCQHTFANLAANSHGVLISPRLLALLAKSEVAAARTGTPQHPSKHGVTYPSAVFAKSGGSSKRCRTIKSKGALGNSRVAGPSRNDDIEILHPQRG
ncbi:hypothetical protein DFJ77DRAFT_245066 [Powellomyces hirtus]|nr:hypothetical protein DFJ77DRAFT_245066 [Powellomyces hirtus]